METSPKEKITEQDANDIKEISSIITSYYSKCHERAKNYGTDPGSVLCDLNSYKVALGHTVDLLRCIKDRTYIIISAIFDSMKDSSLTNIQLNGYSELCRNLINFVGSEERLSALCEYFDHKYDRLNEIDDDDLEKALNNDIN